MGMEMIKSDSSLWNNCSILAGRASSAPLNRLENEKALRT